jgi:pheromone shutdown-related protein TraB
MTAGAASDPAEPAGAGSVEVVGTAHVSSDSVEEVRETVSDRQPDVVAVELDEGRFRQLKGEAPEDLEPADLLGGNTVFQFLAYWMLSYVQSRLGERFDIQPGADMLAAVETAEEHGIDVALVDREIQTTIQRFWARMTVLEKLKLVGSLALATVGVGFGGDEKEELEMEDLTDADVVSAMLEELRRFSPGGAEALIDERDAYIAGELVALREQGLDVVAVVGAGHEAGIVDYLEHPETLPPRASLVGTTSGRSLPVFKALGWLFSLGFIAFFVLLALGVSDQWLLVKTFGAWFLVNGVVAGGLAKLAGARWRSASVGGLVAWMTSVNPLLAPGWFVGYVELLYTRVNVADITEMNEILDDHESPLRDVVSRLLDVPLFRLVVVVAATNIGSFVASILFAVFVFPWLGAELVQQGCTAQSAVFGIDTSGVECVSNKMVEGAREGARVLAGVVS